jgi:Protein of unknown function (DUF3710)
VIFGRKRKAEPVAEPDEQLTEPTDELDAADEAVDDEAPVEADVDEADAEASDDELADDSEPDDAESNDEVGEDDDELDEEADVDDEEEVEEVDWRADGPFDYDEVDLTADQVERLDLGALILTPWQGMGLQLQVQEGTDQVVAALAFWEQSGLELALLAAPTNGGLADELREDLTEEAEQAGGSSSTADGPFGPELRRVLPAEGPAGEQLFQVSRTWFAEGPRWLLRGTLLGEAGLTEDDEGAAAPFVEFFRNVVVRRGDAPRVPGEVIAMTMPTVPQG